MPDLSNEHRQQLLTKLMQSEGYDSVDELIENCYFDSVCPAICANPDCVHTTELEPDQQAGWCEACDGNTMVSALILAGLI